ncbi:MAG: 1-deoxy-D-xylulose-5-phosphate synthase [Clostridia bacterium]|nr:1-deoxy-D-xylulose-5-phosphate synthase [Clostridia bacterium]
MLHELNLPGDLKGLNTAELKQLAQEIRKELIETVSENGGHLASNLGAVELTIALHCVFESPKDKLVFDVGHQAYVHKMLTGRAGAFKTLRQRGGISGFPNSHESPHDSFTAGHASTAISAALGLARARDLRGEKHNVVAVVGDGALTGGMCYEALNDAGNSGTRMIVVLNDNEMSISRNVGAMSTHLSGLRQSASYMHAKETVRGGLEKIPGIGRKTVRLIERIRDAVKAFLVGDRFFEALGFSYSGPINGHDIEGLIKALRVAAKSSRPVVLHVVTRKGQGYMPAQQQPDRYHGLAPKGSGTPKEYASTGAAAADWLIERAKTDERICSVVAAMPSGTQMDRFFERYPKRSFDVGIAEEHAVEMAAGLAAGGMRPFVAIYSTFLQRAVDQIQMDVCLPELPVTFLLDRSGFVGDDGATHQGLYDLTYLRQMPNMTIAVPSCVEDLRRMMELSVDLRGPMAIRYPKTLPISAIVSQGFGIGQAIVLRKGKDAAVWALGPMVQQALLAAELLSARGISLEVVDARFVKPLDEGLLERHIREMKTIFTLEENTICGGFGACVMEFVSRKRLRAVIVPLAAPDRFVTHGKIDEQRKECTLDADSIADTIHSCLHNEIIS